jgi:hypothetical protein
MSRYLPIRVYDYYAPGLLFIFIIINYFESKHVLYMYLLFIYFSERFNETIFDALPTYLLNICEVCGSSQCPYCPIFNSAFQLSIPVTLISVVMLIIAYI